MALPYTPPLREVHPKTWDYLPRATFEAKEEDGGGFEPPRVWLFWNGVRHCLKPSALDIPPDLSEGDVVSVLVLPGGVARVRKVA